MAIAARVGGDPGRTPLSGPAAPPAALRPERLVVMETRAGRSWTRPARRLRRVARAAGGGGRDAGPPWRPSAGGAVRAGHRAGPRVSGAITGWENRWNTRNLLDTEPRWHQRAGQGGAGAGRGDERRRLPGALAMREEAQARYARIAPLADAVIALACPGPAPVFDGTGAGTPDRRHRLQRTIQHAVRPGGDGAATGGGRHARRRARSWPNPARMPARQPSRGGC